MLLVAPAAGGRCAQADLVRLVAEPQPEEGKPVKPVPTETELLKTHGFEADARGVSACLEGMHPTAEQRRRVMELVAGLGADSWRARDAATRALIAMPQLPREALVAALKSEDMEKAARARHVLDSHEGKILQILYACGRLIEKKKLPGLAGPVLRAIPLAEDYARSQLARALRITARPGDADALSKAARSSGNPAVRSAAARALAGVLSKAGESLEPLVALQKDKDPHVALAAATGLAEAGDRRCLPALVNLMGGNHVEVRSRAYAVLRALTKAELSFVAYAEKPAREKALARWKTWIEKNAATAKLAHPLDLGAEGSFLHGNILIATGYANTVKELNPAGKEIWSHSAKGCWTAEKLRNGNVLIAAYSDNKVIEVNRQGKEVWSHKGNCLSAKQLPDGNVLIADYSGSKALEVTRAGKEVWRHKTPSSCTDVQRLVNGNTLIGHLKGAIEVSPTGKTVWSWNGQQVYSAQRLGNGNTLVSELNEGAAEISPAGRVVWKHAAKNLGDAYRLRNGNTLLTTNGKAMEVTRAGKVVWSREGFQYGTVRK